MLIDFILTGLALLVIFSGCAAILLSLQIISVFVDHHRKTHMTGDDKEYYKRERKIHEKFDKAIQPHREMFDSALKQIQYEYDHAIKDYRKTLWEELKQLNEIKNIPN